MIVAFLISSVTAQDKKVTAKRRPVERKESRNVIDLKKLARGVVPAHGFVTKGCALAVGGFGGRLFLWVRKLLGAVSVAGMIALGLFIYTEFTQAWQKRGLPTIPISALAALDKATQQGPAQSGAGEAGRGYRPEQGGARRQQTLSLLDDYPG